jgi:hypothetical protein
MLWPILVSMLKYRDIIHTYRDSSARAAGLEVFEELVLRGEPLAANAARVRLRVLVRHWRNPRARLEKPVRARSQR